MILFSCFSVSAKDSIYSINQYSKEKLYAIEDSYNASLENDGLVMVGEAEDKEETKLILVKYSKKGNKKWIYTTTKRKEDTILDLLYTTSNQQIDGYLVVVKQEKQTILYKFNLEGEFVWEKVATFEIEKIIETKNTNHEIDGYVAVGKKEKNAFLLHYDTEFNIEWMINDQNPNYEQTSMIDVCETENSYAVIRKKMIGDTSSIEVVLFNKQGQEIKVLKDSLEQQDSAYLSKSPQGFILYGVTSEVKLEKGEKSYYLIHFTEEEEDWEVIGNTPVDATKKILLLPEEKENEIEKYFLFYRNESDQTTEVLKLNLEGLLEKKIKKIKSDYYDFESLMVQNDILYLVGQIHCPEEDECDYDENSLFLISDEDVVIEVPDKDSKDFLIITGIIIIIACIGIAIKRKKKLR